MKKPILVVMAAGLGSRYGGLKQMDPMGNNGEVILDFSVYDAMHAGFEETVFIIKRENQKDFSSLISRGIGKKMKARYVYQELTHLPEGYQLPEGREKPWGTAHAVLCAREAVGDAPFAVINADDYYGPEAFEKMYAYLSTAKDDRQYRYAMVGYILSNTLTENGHVARGVCETDAEQFLTSITERTRIEKKDGIPQYTLDNGKTYTPLAADTTVSMNFWGFTPGFMEEIAAGFPAFLENAMKENPLKAEYFLPSVVDRLIEEGKATVKVMTSPDRWYGVTYKEDKPVVVKALAEKKAQGMYPFSLWD